MFCKYYNPLALRDCVNGRTDRTQAAPVRQTDIGTSHRLYLQHQVSYTCSVWYTSWKNRGYLSPMALKTMPHVEERWKTLSEQLSAFKTQGYEKSK